ncbi:MAG: tRNA lysidine(34) synthetase TilS [Chloroflexota bacterium]
MTSMDWGRILRTRCKLDPALPVLAGVSGGADSLCLLGVLHEAGYPVIVAHFNHKLRPEADLESAAVAERARTLGLPFVIDSADVRAWADQRGLSLEEAARTLRYRFLFTAARTHRAQAVAVGHTADDQAETVLMHFLRGAGLAGLKGMEYRTRLPVFDAEIPLVRPLLALWRTDTEMYCREHGLEPNVDASNMDETYFRNRLRLTLIPELEKYNPRFKAALVRTAEALQGDYAALQEVLDKAWEDALSGQGEGWMVFDLPKLAALAPGLRRNLLRRAGETLRPESRDFGFEALERGAVFVENPGGKRVDFANGLYLFAEAGKVYLAAYEADLPFAHWPQISEQLSVVSDQLELSNDWRLTVEHLPLNTDNYSLFTDPSTPLRAGNWSVWLDADLTGGGLKVRPRREGDRFQPLGMEEGTVKLSDFFVNVKLPRRARAKWPLVCAGEEIVWVPGFRPAHPFRVTEKTKRLVKLVLQNTGVSARRVE